MWYFNNYQLCSFWKLSWLKYILFIDCFNVTGKLFNFLKFCIKLSLIFRVLFVDYFMCWWGGAFSFTSFENCLQSTVCQFVLVLEKKHVAAVSVFICKIVIYRYIYILLYRELFHWISNNKTVVQAALIFCGGWF